MTRHMPVQLEDIKDFRLKIKLNKLITPKEYMQVFQALLFFLLKFPPKEILMLAFNKSLKELVTNSPTLMILFLNRAYIIGNLDNGQTLLTTMVSLIPS